MADNIAEKSGEAGKKDNNTGKLIAGGLAAVIGGVVGYGLLGGPAIIASAVVFGLIGAALGSVFD
ncbi:hypothetical protein MSC49_12100 [Methylosinus sp. C49]|jgi:membrane associated rhomboid family serine protease|uniref:hypothetical protein n=1 Tax=Methylosinus TaxID=425 RepID=UPI000367EC51|nr:MULTISPECIES: hypothetical protein [unclassified Methylosinus]BBU61275.1 hypothetical protein MSC49_12100 [Methylosinus sp. C49]